MMVGPYTLATPYILAPMAGVSERPYRVLARRLGAGAAPTELVSALGLVHGQARTQRYMAHDPVAEAPFWVQLFGGEPQAMARGAERAAELGASIIDINMGCPVRKVTRHGAGSGLLCDPKRAAAIVAEVGRATGLPVTAKIRAGWDHDHLNYVEVGQALADAGCAAVALHARTRAQGYSGRADWRMIAELKAKVAIPVVGNGDVTTVAEAHRMRAETACDAIMIGRAALGNPWIFRALTGGPEAVRPAERWRLVAEHWSAHLAQVGAALPALRRFRSHLMWYAHGLRRASDFRRSIMPVEDVGQMLAMAEAFFAGADHDGREPAGERPYDARTALG